MPRFYVDRPLGVGDSVALPAAPAHHVARVLRLRVGEPVVLFNGDGGEYEGHIETLRRADVMVTIQARHGIARESPLAITLAQAISRGERMDFTLQKAVELGVQRVTPLISERTVVRMDEARRERRMSHWRKVIIGACEQSGRASIPVLDPVAPLRQWLRGTVLGTKLVLDPKASQALASIALPQPAVTLLVGSEGGFSDPELDAARRTGFVPVHLGPRILRTETAALVALSVLQSRHGDLSPSFV